MTFEIKKASVDLFDDRSICFISALLADQDDELLFKLGRGKMYKSDPGMGLAYHSKSQPTIFLWA